MGRDGEILRKNTFTHHINYNLIAPVRSFSQNNISYNINCLGARGLAKYLRGLQHLCKLYLSSRVFFSIRLDDFIELYRSLKLVDHNVRFCAISVFCSKVERTDRGMVLSPAESEVFFP